MSGQGIWSAFTGKLGRDTDFKLVKNGTMPFAALNIAIVLDDEGKVQWLRAVAFKDLAREVEGWKKGETVTIEGWLRLDNWTATDGTPRHGLSVIANIAYKGPRRRDRSDQASAAAAHGNTAASAARQNSGSHLGVNDRIDNIGA